MRHQSGVKKIRLFESGGCRTSFGFSAWLMPNSMFSGGCRFLGSSFWQEKEEQSIFFSVVAVVTVVGLPATLAGFRQQAGVINISEQLSIFL